MYIDQTLNSINSTQKRGKLVCNVKKSKVTERLLRVLRRTKFIYGFCKKPGGILSIYLRYHNGIPLVQGAVRVSKPGAKVYADRSEVGKRSKSGLNVPIVSTSKYGFSWAGGFGHRKGVGGEIICCV